MTPAELRKLLRRIRREIGDLPVDTNDGYKVRAAALTILFNEENGVR